MTIRVRKIQQPTPPDTIKKHRDRERERAKAGAARQRMIQAQHTEKARLDGQPMKVICGLCGWEWNGTAGEAKARQLEHRQEHQQ